MFNVLAGKFIALMTSSAALFLGAGPDLALSAMHKKFIRQTATALNIFYGKVFTIGEFAGGTLLTRLNYINSNSLELLGVNDLSSPWLCARR